MCKKYRLDLISLAILILTFLGTSIVFILHGDWTSLKVTGSLFILGIYAVAYSLITFWVKRRKDASFKKTAAQRQNFIVGFGFISVAVVLNIVFLFW